MTVHPFLLVFKVTSCNFRTVVFKWTRCPLKSVQRIFKGTCCPIESACNAHLKDTHSEA